MLDARPLRVAAVIPRYGSGARDDAEDVVVRVLTALAAQGARIDVLATAARSAHASPSGVNVVRFPEDPRNEEAFVTNGIDSSRLIAYLKDSYDRYDAFLFVTYAHGVVARGVVAVAGKAVLLPCVRDEPAASLPPVEAAMHAARVLIFTSEAERELARRLYGPGIEEKSSVIERWIDIPPVPAARRVAGFEPARERYVLYVGKRERAEGLDLLGEAFLAFRRTHPMSELKLCVAGPGKVSLGNQKRGLLDFGDVRKAAKRALLENALAVLAPGCGENAAVAIAEAWAHRKPVGVASRCRAASELVADAGAGWTAGSKADWVRLFETVDELSPEQLARLGSVGFDVYRERTSPERLVARYREIFERAAEPAPSKSVALAGDPWEDSARRMHLARRRSSGRGIDIDLTLLPEYTPADAAAWDVTPSARVSRQLADGKFNVLYVGRLDEDACLEQLVAGLAFLLALGEDTRLILAGRFGDNGSLSERLFAQIGASGLGDRVLLFENVPVSIVAACYRNAHLFWSMAEDWPTVTPVLDAMLFSLPIVAYASPMARVVLGGGGLLFNAKQPLLEAAGLVHVVARDRALRDAIVAAQNERLRDYSPANWLPTLDAVVP
jgi:glycosyltransferase involved in cell wall biosynthesis